MVILFAPGVHTGGGRELLIDLLPHLSKDDLAILDVRMAKLAPLTPAHIEHVKPGLLTRLAAEWTLRRRARDAAMVICFSGLPPLLRLSSRAIVFLQNRLLIDQAEAATAKLMAKRLLFRAAARHVDHLVVQTETMRRCAQAAGFANVVVAPFLAPIDQKATPGGEDRAPLDFFYPADGYPHKNHAALFSAWAILAREGICPVLGVTLSAEFEDVWRLGQSVAQASGARIVNCGRLERREVMTTLRGARAMVYPSLRESFGLPLVEARELGIPVLAAELDYVRDVIAPRETFDPSSAVSMARAVRRFLDADETPSIIHAPATWLSLLSRL